MGIPNYKRYIRIEPTIQASYTADPIGKELPRSGNEGVSFASTTTLSYDIIVTGCQLSCYCANDTANSNASAFASCDAGVLGDISISGDNSTGTSLSTFNHIPEWKLKAGTRINITTGGTFGSGSVVVFGYRA